MQMTLYKALRLQLIGFALVNLAMDYGTVHPFWAKQVGIFAGIGSVHATNNPDPCEGSSDPCCGDPDPCCGSSDPCCGDPDPCCGVDCDAGKTCCNGGCFDTCQEGYCLDEETCKCVPSCSEGEICCDGLCTTCSGSCCNGSCCEGNCCDDNQCYGGPCCGDSGCNAGEQCCDNSECYDTSQKHCCDFGDGTRCDNGIKCCQGDDGCCPGPEFECCENENCYDPASKKCCDDGTGKVCDINVDCCGIICCPIDEPKCCDGITCYDSDTQHCCNDGYGNVCDNGTECCGDNCCEPGVCCINGQCNPVNLAISGLSEEDEEEIGAFIGVNNDDDNLNNFLDFHPGELTVPDYSGISGEDDLIAIDLTVPNVSIGTVTLSISSGLRIWQESTKITEIVPSGGEIVWDFGQGQTVPETLYLEGFLASGSIRDKNITLEYTGPGVTCSDTIKVTVVRVSLTLANVSDGAEETTGGYIQYNDDDDDKSGFEDRLESPVSGELDLVKLTLLDVLPADLEGEVTFTYTGSGTYIKMWNGQEKSSLAPPSPVTFSTTDPVDLPVTYWVEGYGVSSSPRDVELKLSYTVENKTFEDIIKATVVKVDLDAMKISHNVANGELDEVDQLTDNGPIVPVNDDDDDYDSTNQPDKDQSGAIAGESDLLPIILHSIEPAMADSKYTLTIPNHLKVWKNSDRTDSVIPLTTEFNTNVDTTLYVEGFATGSDKLELNWQQKTLILSQMVTRKYFRWDEVGIRTFAWVGPLNVPGYATYQYTATGALGSSQWIQPTGGTIKTGSGTSNVTILWDSGPVVGKAVYQANTNYIWDLEINVVQVKIKTGSSNHIDTPGTPTQNPADLRFIWADPLGSAMEAYLTVEKIEGPAVNGNIRGVKFMEMGFIQDGKMTAMHADYDHFTSPKTRVCITLENGNWYLDMVTSPQRGTAPWYDSLDQTGLDGFFAPPDGLILNHPFNIADTPWLPATDTLRLYLGTTFDDVDEYHIEFDLNLYFAVRTTWAANGSESVYTQRGAASWEFNGGGIIGPSPGYSWTAGGQAGNSGSGAFGIVTDGNVVPIVGTPPVINDLLNQSPVWQTQ